MEKSKIEKNYADLMNHIFTFFKPLGYKKKSNNFRYYDKENNFGKIVNFQKNMWGFRQCTCDKVSASFTINVGLYIPDYECYLCNIKSNEKFIEPKCAVRSRIGCLSPKKYDKWYDLNDRTDFIKLQTELEHDFVDFVIPYLDKVRTSNDVLNNLIYDETNMFDDVRVKTLYHCGYKEISLNILDQLYKKNYTPEFKASLIKLKEELIQNV